jgi:hypothetical protein
MVKKSKRAAANVEKDLFNPDIEEEQAQDPDSGQGSDVEEVEIGNLIFNINYRLLITVK